MHTCLEGNPSLLGWMVYKLSIYQFTKTCSHTNNGTWPQRLSIWGSHPYTCLIKFHPMMMEHYQSCRYMLKSTSHGYHKSGNCQHCRIIHWIYALSIVIPKESVIATFCMENGIIRVQYRYCIYPAVACINQSGKTVRWPSWSSNGAANNVIWTDAASLSATDYLMTKCMSQKCASNKLCPSGNAVLICIIGIHWKTHWKHTGYQQFLLQWHSSVHWVQTHWIATELPLNYHWLRVRGTYLVPRGYGWNFNKQRLSYRDPSEIHHKLKCHETSFVHNIHFNRQIVWNFNRKQPQ